MHGALSVKVVQAFFVKDADAFGEMDPFVVLSVGNCHSRTLTIQEAGISPTWNQDFKFILSGETDLRIRCYDEDTASDENIGEASLFLKQLELGVEFTKEIALHFENSTTHAGMITLKIRIDPEATEEPKNPGTSWAPTPQVIKGPGYVPRGKPKAQ